MGTDLYHSEMRQYIKQNFIKSEFRKTGLSLAFPQPPTYIRNAETIIGHQ